MITIEKICPEEAEETQNKVLSAYYDKLSQKDDQEDKNEDSP